MSAVITARIDHRIHSLGGRCMTAAEMPADRRLYINSGLVDSAT